MVASKEPRKAGKAAKVLVLGSGGREHALAWKLLQSPHVQTVYVNPGNGADYPAAPVSVSDIESVTSFCEREKISLVVIGPEDLLYEGLSERIAPVAPCFGPSKAAAKLEWSKSYSKTFMRNNGIPTADFQIFTGFSAATDFISNVDWTGIVVKADGLAAGKGVTVCSTVAEAVSAAKEMLEENKFGVAGRKIIVEERLYGDEVSVLCFTDGIVVRVLPFIQDYKKLLDGDEGPNTGGMGVVGPIRQLDAKIQDELEDICRQSIVALRKNGIEYKGLLYVGAMVTAKGVKVLEYNCRFGDPETEVLMRLLDTDLYEVLLACCNGTLETVQPVYTTNYTCGIVLASEGYPVKPRKGSAISGISLAEEDEDVVVFQAGTKRTGNELLVNGGRVLCVTAVGKTIREARDRAYLAVGKIYFEGQRYRTDIGAKHIEKSTANAFWLSRTLCYADSGVNIEEGNEFVQQIKTLCEQMQNQGTGSVGGFSALIDFSAMNDGGLGSSQIEVGVDGVGTKLAVADETGYFDEIGQDLVAMCANDVMCHFAEPIAFLYYYVSGRRSPAMDDKDRMVINSVEDACRRIGCIPYGEMLKLPEVYQEKQWDLAGTCIGARPNQWIRRPLKERIEKGDVLLGISSSGLHSNGFSLVRKIFSEWKISYSAKCPWDEATTFGRVLLRGTRLYPKSVLSIITDSEAIVGVAHITGGGLKENVNRVIPEHLKAVIDCGSWKVPKIFEWISCMGPVSCEEMMRTFNCGIGMVLVCKARGVKQIIELFKQAGEEVHLIGQIQLRAEGDDQVEFRQEMQAFSGEYGEVESNGTLNVEASVENAKSDNLDAFEKTIIQLNQLDSCRNGKQSDKAEESLRSAHMLGEFCERRKLLSEDIPVIFGHQGDGFGCCVDFSKFKESSYGTSKIVATMHGIGAKLAILEETGGFYEEIGRSLVELCVDDVVCHGARPEAFLDYYVTGKLDKSKAILVLKAVASACDKIGCALVGGETAEMPGVYQKNQWDLAGVCIGARRLQQPELPMKNEMVKGDVLIGIGCKGLRSSGFKLVHKILKAKDLRYSEMCPWDDTKTIAEALLLGTHMYAEAVLPVLESGLVLAAANISDGGLSGNLAKILPEHLKAIIDCSYWSIPQVFEWIQFTGGVPFYQMMNTFNCGIGMVLLCKQSAAHEVCKLLQQNGEDVFTIGQLQERTQGEDKVEFANEFETFQILNNSKQVNIAVLISGAGTNMKALIESCLNPDCVCRVTLVISNRDDATGIKIARSYGVKTVIIPFRTATQRKKFEETAASLFEERSIDVICLAGFMKILSGDFVRGYEGRMLNIHPSLLPAFKGGHAVEDALAAKARETGCTVHFVTEEVDCGEIVLQASVPIHDSDRLEDLRARIQEQEHVVFPLAMHKVAQQIAENRKLAVDREVSN